MAQQTAVAWLILKFQYAYDSSNAVNRQLDILDVIQYFNEAKEIEKNQIIDAFDAGTIDDNLIGNEYFDQTFNKKQI